MRPVDPLVPPVPSCHVCKLVEVLEYARVELDRLAKVHEHPHTPLDQKPRGIIINMLQLALDQHRGHAHHLRYLNKGKA